MTEKEFDIVVIGSGAGGGTVAKELSALCRDGVKIAVLEWGPKFKEEEFTGREIEMANRIFFEGGGALTKDRSMTLAYAKAYGGSTVVYTGTSLPIQKETVQRWDVPGIEYEDLRRRADKYIKENNVHLLEPDKINDNNRLFREGCEKLGYRVEQFPVNLKGCQGSGLCNLGCPNAAKQGTHRVQLPEAEKNGVTVITNCRVDRIEAPTNPLERPTIVCSVVDPGFGHTSAWPFGEYRVKAKTVVVSAGAVNSPALLLRSGFEDRLPALGRYFTTHPALIQVGEHPRPITNFYGHPKSYYCDHFADSEKFVLETCMYFPFVTAKNLAGFGQPHAEMMAHFDRLQMILVLAIDEARRENRVTIDREGKAVVDYKLSEETMRSLLVAMRQCARIFFASGAVRVHSPASETFFVDASEKDRIDELMLPEFLKLGKISITSAHLMGGCRMGTDVQTSVTDSWGRVHGMPWLHVADASLMPKAAEINPYITIMSLADRVAEGIKTKARELMSVAA